MKDNVVILLFSKAFSERHNMFSYVFYANALSCKAVKLSLWGTDIMHQQINSNQ